MNRTTTIAMILVLGLSLAPLASAAPVAKATTSKTTLTAGESATFSASSSTVDDGRRIVSYQWAFGDGSSASGARVTHNYTKNGQYTVQLTIVDSTGQRATDTVTVNVLAPKATGPTLEHTAITTAPAGKAIEVTVKAGGSAAVRTLEVFYKRGDRFVNLTATKGLDGSYAAKIPAASVVAGLEYYVRAVDTNGKSTRLPAGTATFPVAMAGDAPTTPTSTPTTETPTSGETPAAGVDKETPAPGVFVVLGALGLLALALRRR